MVVFIAALACMAVRVLIKRDQLTGRPLVIDANIYVPLFYIVAIVGGILPTVAIHLWTGNWCAPPFNYSSEPKRIGVILLHVVPAISWLVCSAMMVFSTTLSKFTFHRVLGLSWMQSIFIIFEVSSIYSLVSDRSPLGKHVQSMEWLLVVGTWFYFVLGMLFISIQTNEDTYHTGHKICMVTTMITASGPGFFRVLRHLRELVTGRIFKPTLFTNYSDVPNNSHNWKNFKDVESTYFCLAISLTTTYLTFVFYKMGTLLHSDWSALCLVLVALPFVGVLVSILWRFVPGHHQDFDFSFALDYNFKVLKDAETNFMSSMLRPEENLVADN